MNREQRRKRFKQFALAFPEEYFEMLLELYKIDPDRLNKLLGDTICSVCMLPLAYKLEEHRNCWLTSVKEKTNASD